MQFLGKLECVLAVFVKQIEKLLSLFFLHVFCAVIKQMLNCQHVTLNTGIVQRWVAIFGELIRYVSSTRQKQFYNSRVFFLGG